MVVALRDVRVRGEIHTIIDYAADMLQSPEFMNNSIHTGWLDSRIAANVRAERPPWHLCVIGAAAVRAHEAFACKAAEYLGFLAKGQLPPHDVSLIYFKVSGPDQAARVQQGTHCGAQLEVSSGAEAATLHSTKLQLTTCLPH
eukprot:GHRQ01030357.1.p2 GENE.GHRQ01030357.1~~GHRQ01030357.1.p2  ORF type:complete len:143 (-),score=57.78 GHRQ01030357.1:402-830(-)